MFLEPWMIATLAVAFGICAFLSKRSGFNDGAILTLQALEEQKLIKIEEDGSIKRWTPYAELPVKKARKRK
jgi:hypothetical protein